MRSASDNPRWAPWAVAGAAFVLYAWTASGQGYWLDSPEFTAAAIDLDIPHPPGHPLANLWGKAFALLPVAALPYRVAMGQAVAAALVLGLVQCALARTLARMTSLSIATRLLLSLAAVSALGGSYGFWFQAVRAEVYALQALLVCLALERLSVLACSDDARDPRPFYAACLALGFGLANHHFIALLALPALLYEFVRLLKQRGARVIAGGVLAALPGLSTYVYLPLRALNEPRMDLGHPVGFTQFAWVVSARIYARNIGSEARQPLAERFADMLVILIENFTLLVLPLALLGGYVLLRNRRTHAVAYLWLSTALISLCGRAWLNPVRSNPDVLGYMMPGFAALLALAAAGVASLLEVCPARARPVVAPLTSLSLLVLALLQVPREAARASLRTFAASDAFDELRRRRLPTHALLVLTSPDSVFRHWEGEAVERLRGDVTLLPVPFLGYGDTHEVLLRKEPTLRALVAEYLERGELSAAHLQALARERPVLVELDTRAALSLYDVSVAEGPLFRLLAPLERRPWAQALASRAASDALLHTRAAPDIDEPETRKQLLMSDYIAGLYFARHGALSAARSAIARALTLAPHSRELLALDHELAQHSQGAIDIAPFLPDHEAPGERAH